MKQLFLKDNAGTYPIRTRNWYPGKPERQLAGPPDGVSQSWSCYVRNAKRRGSRYLTMAYIVDNDGALTETAFCCPKDVPLRKLGYHKAVGRLIGLAKSLVYIVVEKVEAVELDLVQNPGFGVPAVGSAGVFEKWGEDPQLAEDTHIYYTTVAGVRGEA
jgi:hypothetical protein